MDLVRPRQLRLVRTIVVAAIAAVTLVTGMVTDAMPAAAADATVSGPVTGGAGTPSVSTTSFDLSKVGYEQSEYFLSGTAQQYSSANPLTNDGRWTVTGGDPQPYTTRLVVYRPTDAEKFNGTVVVEWLNVSGGVDAGPDWVMTHTELVRDGFAWVGVSAQAAGLNAAKTSDATRYASISHPGDSYSYDIYSQAGRAVRSNPKVLAGLHPKTLLAAGESQSAARMVTYIDALANADHVYDGYLVHSRSATGAPLQGSPPPAVGAAPTGQPAPINAPAPTQIRTDVDTPVFVVQTETDVYNSNTTARQPDTKTYRLWEVAGTSHYDEYGLTIGTTDTGDGQGAVQLLAAMQAPTNDPIPGTITCNLAINTGPAHWALNAAIFHLNRWVTKHVAPPVAPRLETTTVAPVAYSLDDTGNARGGVRSPQVDVPIAVLGGTTNTGNPPLGTFCRLFGTTVPLTPAQLAAAYPTHDKFVADWQQAVDRALKAGWLLPADAKELRAAAQSAKVPS
jgi:hypothetical protein